MKTNAEKQAWHKTMRDFARKVGRMTEKERTELAARMPALVTCEGHPLTVFNTCFLAFQTDRTLTMVGGFRQWLKQGRAVRKGEHAAGSIYVPINAKTRGEEADAEASEEKTRFLLVPVFDVSQTQEISSGKEEAA